MNKDVIYIDVEDDVTAIIGKIKASKEKIVALVPPKRVGILQSAVNLRLLDRMAHTSDKHLVLITNNQALIALSAAAGIPVAKNLQTKPEIAEITALNVDDDEDIIDGSHLPIGELEKTSDKPKSDPVDDAIEDIVIDDTAVATSTGMGAVALKKPLKSKSGVKVPNFNSFRKRLFIGIAAFIVLVIFLIWANVYAPAATVIITAKTVPTPISDTVALGTAATNVANGTIQAVTQTLQKNVSVKFTPTGQQDIGTPAAYKVTLSAREQTSTDVPAGTNLTSSDDLVFVTQSDAVIPAYNPNNTSCFPQFCPQSVTVVVNAQSPGTSYNNESGSLAGAPNGVSASFQSQTTTGTPSDIVTAVSTSDVTTATTALDALSTANDEKQLISQFKNGEYIISASFNVVRATPVSSPAVGAQASGQATLTSAVTYTINALAQPDIKQFLDASLKQQINGSTDQRVYDDGIGKVVLAGYTNVTGTPSINIATTGQVGPNIDTTSLKQQIKGKKSGEVQALLSNISGVSNVEVDFSYPWVTSVPNDVSKVDIQFKLTN